MHRRQFIQTAAGALGWAAVNKPARNPMSPRTDHFSSNEYPWLVFYQREGRQWNTHLDSSLGEFARSGIKGYEPSITDPGQIAQLVPLLQKHGLRMSSIYVNSVLHDRDRAEQSVDLVLSIAEASRSAGVTILVTNPSPIRWGGPEDKTDTQLEIQASYLESLGAELQRNGQILAYHNHDPEMRQSAREFHHMMLATHPDHVKLCLDAHWIYRGSGNSQVALFDIVRLYGSRIAEVHLRQSRGGIWTETFAEGDIDYRRLATALSELKIKPHLVLEQAVEKDSSKTTGVVDAHRQSLAFAAQVFERLAP